MSAAELVLTAASLTDEIGATPLPETGSKVDLIAATVRETLERLREGDTGSPQ